jgi:hypothetical protein
VKMGESSTMRKGWNECVLEADQMRGWCQRMRGLLKLVVLRNSP